MTLELDDLDRRITEMSAMREELRKIIEQWDGRLAATRDGEVARLLEQLTIDTEDKP